MKNNNQKLELQEILESITEKSMDLLKRAQAARSPDPFALIDGLQEMASNAQSFAPVLIDNAKAIGEAQLAYWQDATGLWYEQLNQSLEGEAPTAANDKRFSADEWVKHPFYNALSKQYSLAKAHMDALVNGLDSSDEALIKRMKFITGQYLDALSPDNFLLTNPQVMAETIQSNGKNLLLGLQNLLSDVSVDPCRLNMKMTDKTAFKVGENIAATPGKVIYKNKLIELIQYTPQTPTVKSVPLLIIPPWINKYYILDLSPHNSLIRWIVEQGMTVFVISWVNPNASYAKKGMADYLDEGPIAAIKVIQKQMHVKQVNTLGFCIGGTLQSMLLAYHKAKNIKTIRSATFLASLIDFSDPGDISVYIDEKQIAKLEQHMDEKGYLEGHMMASAFNSLRASDLIWSFFIKNYLQGRPPAAFDLLFWNSQSTNMPAQMHSEYLRWMYLNNDLIKPGKIHIHDTPLDISKIDIPTFFVSTKKDHIAPWKTTYVGYQLMQGRKHFVLGGSGHIAGIIIPPGSDKYGYQLNKASPVNPDQWLVDAQEHSGSWWPEWIKWLKKESGQSIPAPDWSTLPIKAIEDAPGRYALK